MTFELGQTYGGYQFVDVMETSRAGVVYRVRNLAENRFELLRVLPAALQQDPESVERFFREGKLRARLAHPNIVSFYHAGLLEGHCIMTTETVEGRNLADRLELGPMEAAEAAETAIQALNALAYLHQYGVVHRDVTAANLLITPERSVKLTGFSFARAASDPRLTQLGAALGDVRYLAPEQVRAVGEPDARADLYSMGVVLYEMLTGKRPFDADSQFDIMAAHVHTPPVPPSRLNGLIPVELDAVALKALAKEPARRFQTAAEFREGLQAPGMVAAEEELSRTEATPEPAPVPEPMPAVAAAPEARVSPSPGPASGFRPAAAASLRSAAGAAAQPDLPEMRLGLREFLVLGLGVAVMVAAMMALAR